MLFSSCPLVGAASSRRRLLCAAACCAARPPPPSHCTSWKSALEPRRVGVPYEEEREAAFDALGLAARGLVGAAEPLTQCHIAEPMLPLRRIEVSISGNQW